MLASPALADDADASLPAEDAAQDQLWIVHTARMEGASVNVEEAAADLQKTAAAIAEGGRLTALAALAADAEKLDRRVVSARLAAQVLTDVK